MYCEEQDIIDDFKDLVVSSSSIITNAKLQEWIDQESSYIDARISLKYVTPIDQILSPEAFKILKRICIFRTSLRVKNVLEVRSDASQANSEEKFADSAVRRFEKDLQMIADGNLPLIDATPKDSRKGVSSFTSKASGNCAFFDVNKQQW